MIKLNNKPLVSVITVVYDGEKYLEKTIQSVINQDYDNLEYVIIDGGSSDATLDIIKKYESKITYWVSEKDDGIYDAMNKGIDLVSGDWINFMNAGDVFYDCDVLKNIFNKKISQSTICIYGDVMVEYGGFSVLRKSGNIDKLNKGMQFSHQSLFTRSNYHKTFKFDTSYKSAADFKFIYTIYVDGYKFLNSNITVSKVSNGGLSDVRRLQSIIEGKRAVLERSNTFSNRVYFYFLYLKILIVGLLKKYLPNKIIIFLQKIK
jgi:glycosyltransferase involved in cell wall biosynthesis